MVKFAYGYSPNERSIRKVIWPYIKTARGKSLSTKFKGMKADKIVYFTA